MAGVACKHAGQHGFERVDDSEQIHADDLLDLLNVERFKVRAMSDAGIGEE